MPLLDPIPLDQTPSCFIDLGKSAGFNKSGAKTKGDIDFNEVVEVYGRLANGDVCRDYHSTVGFRSHLVGASEEDKVRVIHVTPGPLTMVEKCFAYPLQESMIRHPYQGWATGWSWEKHGGRIIPQRFDVSKSCSVDFQAFDLSCRVRLTRDIFALWKERFCLTSTESNVFDSLVETHCENDILFFGKKMTLTDGIRTGSAFTHIMGTCVSVFLMEYAGAEKYMCYGDDCIVEFDKQTLINVLASTGFVVHPKKSVSGQFKWLGLKMNGANEWVIDGVESRIAKTFIPEPGKNMHSLATRMQCFVLNAGRDPMAERFMCLLERNGCDRLSDELNAELQKWGREYVYDPRIKTIRQLYEYFTYEFV
jgi:hypothetical protein